MCRLEGCNIAATGGNNRSEIPGNIVSHNDVKIDSNPAYMSTEYLGEGE